MNITYNNNKIKFQIKINAHHAPVGKKDRENLSGVITETN